MPAEEAGQDRGEDMLCRGGGFMLSLWGVGILRGKKEKNFIPFGIRLSENAKCCSKGVRTWPWGTSVTLDSSVKEIYLWLFTASFSRPLLRREEAAEQGKDTSFYCHSAGGFPEPQVHWLINHTAEPPEGLVRTVATLLPDSYLYNITSYLKVNISKALSVSCAVENALLNETFTSTSCEWQIL